jgi:uncharacterized protein
MNNHSTLKKILHFPLTKIIIGSVVVGGAVALGETVSRFLLGKTQLSNELINLMVAIVDVLMALMSYVLLFRFYEKRKITELSLVAFFKNALIGFSAGIVLQSLFIVVIYLAGDYSITLVNPVSFLLPAFTTAFTAGFVAELLLRGIIFRLTEEKLGTVIALIIAVLFFAIMHSGSKNATLLSVLAASIQAGLLLSAAYVFTRTLWLSVFLHFAWDFAEPGIFGAINPGNTVEASLFTSKISGPEILTGGLNGPGNSIQSIIFCLITALIFLWLAKQKNNFIKPFWQR